VLECSRRAGNLTKVTGGGVPLAPARGELVRGQLTTGSGARKQLRASQDEAAIPRLSAPMGFGVPSS
jgi:hypothetical protein